VEGLRIVIVGLFISMLVTHLLLALILYRLDREPGVQSLLWGSLCGFLGGVLHMGQAGLPEFLPFVVANVLFVLAPFLFWRGVRAFAGQPELHAAWWGVPVSMAVLAYWFGYHAPSMGGRVAAVGILMSISLVGITVSASRYRDRLGWPAGAIALASVSGLMAFVSLFRIGIWWVTGVPESALDRDPLWTVPQLIVVSCLTVIVVLLMALAVSRLVERLDYLARHDPLSGLLNRLGLRLKLNQILRASQSAEQHSALLVLDFDEFKRINDQYGHDTGDQVIRRFGQILRRYAGPCDIPVRMGGEEFALVSSVADPVALAETIRTAFSEQTGDLPKVTLSVGIAKALPLNPVSVRDAFRVADRALYRAKALGRDQIVVLDELSASDSSDHAVDELPDSQPTRCLTD
jgi:diguanylate cyclase (GGDEF)-like protein